MPCTKKICGSTWNSVKTKKTRLFARARQTCARCTHCGKFVEKTLIQSKMPSMYSFIKCPHCKRFIPKSAIARRFYK